MRRRTSATLLLVAALLAGLVVAAQAAKDDLSLVSRASGVSGAAGAGGEPSISADGRFVAFSSSANNLSAEDNDATSDVFVRDLQTSTTTLVSRVSGAAGAAADGESFAPAISADGRFVAFNSDANNLSGEDDNAPFNIFVRDLQTNVTTYASRATGVAGAAANNTSLFPSLSADGRFVAFQSLAGNLSTEDGDVVEDVFVRDLETNTTVYASRASGAAGVPGDGASASPSISADGRLVAFHSFAGSLSDEDDDTAQDIFVRDLETNVTTFVSRASGASGAAGDQSSSQASISPDGRFVAFTSGAANLTVDDLDAVGDVYVRDLQTNATIYVSRASGAAGAPGDGGSSEPSISTDGRFVAFQSAADSLTGDDNNAVTNVFVRDLTTNATTYVSRAAGAAGSPADATSSNPSISGDGRFVGFHSDADNLSGEDDDTVQNVFVRDVLGPPAVPPGPLPPAQPSPPGDAADTFGPGILGALSRVNGTVQVSSSGRFRLFCGRYSEPVSGTCGARSAGTAGAAQGGRRLRVGARRFTAAAGRRALVRFRLSRRNLRRLRAARRVRMRGTVVARDSLGNPTTARFRFTLRAPVR